jgi:hypothetical protein
MILDCCVEGELMSLKLLCFTMHSYGGYYTFDGIFVVICRQGA